MYEIKSAVDGKDISFPGHVPNVPLITVRLFRFGKAGDGLEIAASTMATIVILRMSAAIEPANPYTVDHPASSSVTRWRTRF